MDPIEYKKQVNRIRRAAVQIMNDNDLCYLAGVILCGDVAFVDSTTAKPNQKTAWTDGWNVGYNLDYTASLTNQELVGLVMHENLHKAYRHISRGRDLCKNKEDMEFLALAADFVVNADTVAAWEKNPSLVALDELGYEVYDAKFRGWSFERIFRYIKSNADKYQHMTSKDDHVPGEGNDASEGGGSQSLSSAEKDQQIAAALTQGQTLVKARGGAISGAANRAVQGLVEPQVPWQTVISQWLSDMTRGDDLPTYSRLAARSAMFSYPIPTWYDITLTELVIAVDTSGSISQGELRTYLSEMVGLLNISKPETVHLVYWDTRVRAHELYTREDLNSMATSTKPAGGGGTDLTCVPDYLAEKGINPKIAVVFTDGYVGDDWGVWPCSVFVALTNRIACPYPNTVVQCGS